VKLSSIVARISEEVSAYKLVGGAAEFVRAAEGLMSVPAAFVLPASETASENEFASQVVQQNVRVQFEVLLALRNLSDSGGASATDELLPLRHATRQALLNWVPEGAEEGCEFRSGQMLQFVNGTLWWQDRYSTAYIIRSD
jgi:hypothetical protein